MLYVTTNVIIHLYPKYETDHKISIDGMQEIAYISSPDNVIAGTHREYGHSTLKAQKVNSHVDRLFEGLEDSMRVWMSHGDKLAKLPKDFHTVATSDNSEYAAIAHNTKSIYGLQFHPEVTHTSNGIKLLENFALGICECKQNWTMSAFMDQEIARIRQLVGEKGQVLGAVSGGVDSTVAAKLMVCHSQLFVSILELGVFAFDSSHKSSLGRKANKIVQKEAIGSRFWAVLVNST